MGFELIFTGTPVRRIYTGGPIANFNRIFIKMEFGSIKNVIKAVSLVGPVTVCSDHNVEPQVFGSGVYLEQKNRFNFCFLFIFYVVLYPQRCFPA
jgi:hypothetical protein